MDRIINNGIIGRAGHSQEVDETASAGQLGPSAADDAISLSPVTQDAERIGGMVEEFTADRLSQVREAMADGTYRVSGEAIAQKLIELRKR